MMEPSTDQTKKGELLLDWPSNIGDGESKGMQDSVQKRFYEDRTVDNQGLASGKTKIDNSPASVQIATAKDMPMKRVQFTPRSRLHQYHQHHDTKKLCYSKSERKAIQRDAAKWISRIRRVFAANSEMSLDNETQKPEEAVLALSMTSQGMAPEEIIGIEHFVVERERANVVATVVHEWRRLNELQQEAKYRIVDGEQQGSFTVHHEPLCDISQQIGALSRKMSKPDTKKARRRAKFVHWMNDFPTA